MLYYLRHRRHQINNGYPTNLYQALLNNFTKAIKENNYKLVDKFLNWHTGKKELVGNRLFCLAVACGHLRIAASMLEHGANPDSIGKSGSALEIACLRGNIEMVQLLLEAGAEPNLNCGKALLIAATAGHYKIVNLLCRYGADVTAHHDAALKSAEKHQHHKVQLSLLYFGANVSVSSSEETLRLAKIVEDYTHGVVRESRSAFSRFFCLGTKDEKDITYLNGIRVDADTVVSSKLCV